MGKISVLNQEQKNILDLICANKYLKDNFYFTGGTALSEFYLKHRYSEDLDFFSENRFDQQIILTLITEWSEMLNFRFTSRFVEIVYRFDIFFKNGINFKIDFGYYPYPRVEKGIEYKTFTIDSLRDIATNKLFTLNQRTDVKDFVDLYFLLQNKYTVWDLFYSLEVKFKQFDLDIVILSEDLLKVEDFNLLPKMIKPLTLEGLKKFFRQKAIELARRAVE